MQSDTTMKTLIQSSLAAVILLFLSSCSFEVTTANITDAKLYKDEAATQEATTFSQSDTFYLVANLANAPDSTVTKARWIAADVEGDVPKDHLLQEFELTSGSGVLTFNLSNNQLWPKGTYRVELVIADKVVKSLDFVVE